MLLPRASVRLITVTFPQLETWWFSVSMSDGLDVKLLPDDRASQVSWEKAARTLGDHAGAGQVDTELGELPIARVSPPMPFWPKGMIWSWWRLRRCRPWR